MNGTNASYFPEMTNLLKDICNDIAKKIIKEGQPIVLIDAFDWYREVLSLFAKQVNLCDSCMLLLENGMEQEAYLLARSQFNNMLWIKYICEGEDDSRVKEYFYQPHISQVLSNRNFKKMITDFSDELDERFLEAGIMERLDRGIEENTQVLIQENIPIKVKSIAELAKQDGNLFGMYVTFYNEGSRFEHSDMSKTKLYRKQVAEAYSPAQAFVFDLGESDKECWVSVFRCSFMSIFFAFESLWNRVSNREEQLFWKTEYGNAAYTKEDFQSVLWKMAICQEMLNEC
ncbi:MAG: hypothetical protein IKL49_01075 [Lachnospiraceae bacterium]|nr:hypothetical protein [Lachnospiraceae bacterium]